MLDIKKHTIDNDTEIKDVGEGFINEEVYPTKRLAREELDRVIRMGKDVKRTSEFKIEPELVGIKDIVGAVKVSYIRDINKGRRIKLEDI